MSSWSLGVLGYCLLFAVLIGLGVVGRRPGTAVPRGGRLLASARAGRVGRVVVVLCWWWVGWHLFVR